MKTERKSKIVVYTSIINPMKPFGVFENYDTLKERININSEVMVT